MNLRLEPVDERDGVVRLRSRTTLPPGTVALRYRTRTGALVRVGGIVRGAFDREHDTVPLQPDAQGAITLEVERRSLPTNGLPPRDGLRWRWLLARAHETPANVIEAIAGAPAREKTAGAQAGLTIAGHAHLDVAWLWTYAEARRKVARTFATAARQLEADSEYVFIGSQPQLYAWVEADEPGLFERVRALAKAGRFDASGAALWVEPDCNLPSGESHLRQLVHGIRYVRERLGIQPSVAWLPDSFGFPNTLPTLFAHAGVNAFATTKLAWNDTTPFPYAQFVWEGPDGSRVLAAQITSMEGAPTAARIERARRRGEPLLIGYGDGGGGATDTMLERAHRAGTFASLETWFRSLAPRAAELPVHRDELYLEYHRGTYTTHHGVKAGNAALERLLLEVEQLGAWAVALHASPFFLAELRNQLREAWEIVLRGQFHDVLPGTSIGEVYADVQGEHRRAERLLSGAADNARSVLPRAKPDSAPVLAPPRAVDGGFTFESALLSARVAGDGTLLELSRAGAANVVARANVLTAYVDRPARWDAWNIDRTYTRRTRPVRFEASEIVDDALEFRLRVGESLGVLRVSCAKGEPFLRFDLALEWRERHTLLRCENEFAVRAERARCGTPHGTIERPLAPRTKAERAKFEFPAQRFVAIGAPSGGCALFALDTYGWSLGATRDGRAKLGHSLLRGSTWPDPHADLGEQIFAYAFVPLAGETTGEIERLWERYARAPEVAMFVCDSPGVLVVATKPADDGDGVIVRARECNGERTVAALACAARARDASSIDALERSVEGDVELRDGALHATFAPFQLRSFRVRLA
jgi:alpha-mannosidase